MIDPLSDVLRSVRLTGGVFLEALFTAPWCVLAEITRDDCRPFLSAPGQVIAYHFVIEGTLVLGMDGSPPVEVQAGEIVLLPRNDPHTLASAHGLDPVRTDDLIQVSPDGGLARIDHGGGGPPTRLVCGFLGTEAVYNPLIAALPRLLKLDVRQGTARDWVEASVRFAAAELAQGRLASSGVISRLSELLFVEAVRHYSLNLDEQDTGWLKGIRDPQIGRALALIHQRIDGTWSAEALAREVALSRSAFIERFTTLIGTPPIRYATTFRLQAARLQLRETRRTVAQVAHAVGYESEEAFSRAFKREFGLSPARWRERQAMEDLPQA
ncbi:MAG: cupin domain-containing protein [Acetobacteraceae bacterium]